MNVRVERAKRLLTTVGAALPAKVLLDAQIALNYAQLGRWMRDRGFTAPIRQTTREDCWDQVAATIGSRPVLYLEFGVWQGASIKYWSKLLRHPDSRLHGFDSFEGLPESFDGGVVVTRSQATDTVPSMGHSVADQVAAIDNDKMDGWAGVSGCGATSSPHYACVSGFSLTQVPNITALANSFAVSDRTFSMADPLSQRRRMADFRAVMYDRYVSWYTRPVGDENLMCRCRKAPSPGTM